MGISHEYGSVTPKRQKVLSTKSAAPVIGESPPLATTSAAASPVVALERVPRSTCSTTLPQSRASAVSAPSPLSQAAEIVPVTESQSAESASASVSTSSTATVKSAFLQQRRFKIADGRIDRFGRRSAAERLQRRRRDDLQMQRIAGRAKRHRRRQRRQRRRTRRRRLRRTRGRRRRTPTARSQRQRDSEQYKE